MIFDHRTYTCRPGTIKKQLALYGEHGFPAQCRHLGHPWLYAATEIGDVNSYVHIWAFESITDRAEKRARMQADPDWQAYLAKSAEAGNQMSQKNKILTAVSFFDPGRAGKAD